MKVKFKAHDESGTLDSLKVYQWGYKYYTKDTQIPIIKEREERKRNREAGDTSMFGSRKGGIQMTVVISDKMQNERLPKEIANVKPRSPVLLKFSHVRYKIQGNTLFINYFSEVSK